MSRAMACVLHADVIIALLHRADPHHGAAVDALHRMAADGVALLVSSVDYAETLVRPAQDDGLLRIAVAAIDAMDIRPVAVTASTAQEAARHRAHQDIRLADAFAVATAKAHDARLATFDLRVRRASAAAGVPLSPHLDA